MKCIATIALTLLLLLAAVAAVAQMTPRAPELKKLDYFAGTWSIDASIGARPWGPGGTFTATVTNEWMKGDNFLVGHSDFSRPPELGGRGTNISIFGYDPDKKVFTPGDM